MLKYKYEKRYVNLKKQNSHCPQCPEEDFNPNRTNLVLYMKKDSSYLNSYLNNYLNQINDTQTKILEIVRENQTLTIKEISNMMPNITYDGVKCNIGKFKDMGY